MIGFDFNPNREAVAAIDRYGMCTISDIATNRLCLQKKLDRIVESKQAFAVYLLVLIQYSALTLLPLK